MIIGYFLITTNRTSADLFDEDVIDNNRFSMSTLAMSLKHSANSSPKSTLFNISGLLPEGFDVGAVKIKKAGQINFKYQISSDIVGSNTLLCQQLEIEIWSRRQQVYLGSLNNLAINKNIDNDGVDDWVIFISLNNNNLNLKNLTCDFNIKFQTYKINPGEQKGFWDREVLTNSITSGEWE